MTGRWRLFNGVALPALTSLWLANMAAMTPAHAMACTAGAVIDATNGTTCASGSSNDGLTYPDSNGNYQNGDFTLTLNHHFVTNGGIVFSGAVNGDGRIVLENFSHVNNAAGHGIEAFAADGDITIDVLDVSSITGSFAGIHAQASGDVSVNVTAGGNVRGGNSDGIFALSDEGVVITTGDRSEVKGGSSGPIFARGNGIWAAGNAGGAVTVVTGANSKVDSQQDHGIDASSSAGTLTIATGAGSTVRTQAGFSGIRAISASGFVEVTTGANSEVTGARGAGIFAQTRGTIKISTGDGPKSFITGVDGIVAVATDLVTINVGTDSAIVGRDGGGLVAHSIHGAVSIGMNAGSLVAGDNGILTTASGPITIVTGADSVIFGRRGDGIDAASDGAVTVVTGADSFVVGSVGNGIQASSFGAVAVVTGANSLVDGRALSGISAHTEGTAIITIVNNGRAVGSFAGIEAGNGTGAIQITNSFGGLIDNRSAGDSEANLAIRTEGGATTIGNNQGAIIRGRIVTGNRDDVLNNSGRWFTEGVSNFGGGSDTINNNAEIFAGNDFDAADITTFAGLETLNNSGLINLSDQDPGNGNNISDRLQTSGNYAGLGDAALVVDAFLGHAGSVSDVLAVGGNTSGVTRIFVNNTSLGPGAPNNPGILVVDVTGTAHEGDFVLANGPIDAGFFVYELVFNNTDQKNDQFRLVSEVDGEVFETSATLASSQEIWLKTADAWAARRQAVRDRASFASIVTAAADPALSGSVAPENGLWFQGLGNGTMRDSWTSGFDQSVKGFVAGADADVDLGDGSTLLFGVLAGYVDSSLNFDASPTSIKTDGTTLGVYASLLDGGFFANALIQADLFNLNFSAPSLPGDNSDDADVISVGARVDIGYRFDAGGLFVEPMLSLDAVSTSIDEFSVGGADIDPGSTESFRAGAGLRLGLAGEKATASLTGRVWSVFATDNEVVFTAGDTVLNLSDDGLEGLYGEISGQVDVGLSETIVLSAKGGVLFSDDIPKPSVTGGLNFTW